MVISSIIHASYEPIKLLISKYKRPVTVLVMGLDTYDIAFDIARVCDSTVVIVEEDYKLLLERCCKENDQNILLLSRSLNYNRLKKLSECEHFDLSIIGHQFFKSYSFVQQILNPILLLGDHLFVQLPHPNRSGILDEMSKAHNVVRDELQEAWGVCHLDNGKFEWWYLEGIQKYLARSVWWKSFRDKKTFEIVSDFEEKRLIKHRAERDIETEWKKGINLFTFKIMQGVYPLLNLITERVIETKKIEHNDWAPHNIIIQGTHVEMIDFEDTDCRFRWSWPEEAFRRFMLMEKTDKIIAYIDYLKKVSAMELQRKRGCPKSYLRKKI